MTIFGFTFGLSFLWALPLILAPALAFLSLRARRQRLDVSSLLLFRDLPRRTTFQNLSMTHKWHRWLYALMFAVLALIALGLSALLPAPKRLIVVDTSASMNAEAGNGKSRFDRAVAAADAEIDKAMAAGASVALVSLTNLGDDVPFVTDRLEARAQLNALSATSMPAPMDQRLSALSALSASRGVGALTLVTDRPLSEEIDAPRRLSWIDVGDDLPSNVGFEGVSGGLNLFDAPKEVSLRNFGTDPLRDVSLTARVRGKPAVVTLRRPFDLPAGARETFPLDRVLEQTVQLGPGPKELILTSGSGDPLPLDDGLWVVPEVVQQFDLHIVRCEGNGYLFDRFLPHPNIRLSESAGITDEADYRGYDAVIFDRCPEGPLFEELNANAIVIETRPGAGRSENGSGARQFAWQASENRHPVMAGLKPMIGRVTVGPSLRPLPFADEKSRVVPLLRDVDPQDALTVIAEDRVEIVTAFAAERRDTEVDGVMLPAAKMLFLGFDPHAYCTNFIPSDAEADNTVEDRRDAQIYGPDDCLTLTFMMMNTLEWMDDRRQRIPQYLAAGDPLTLDGIRNAVVRTDEAEVPPVITDDLGVSRWRLDQAGLYFLSGEGLSQTVPLSLALFNAEESALTRAPVTALPDFSALSRGDGLRRLTRPLVIGLLAIAVLEALFLIVLAGRFRKGPSRRVAA